MKTMSLVKTSLELKTSISSKTYRLFVVPANLRARFISSNPKVRTFLQSKKETISTVLMVSFYITIYLLIREILCNTSHIFIVNLGVTFTVTFF